MKRVKKSVKSKKKEEIFFPYYWICGACAEDRGGTWPKGHVATASFGDCRYCNGRNQGKDMCVVPYVDYNWPGLLTSHLRD